MTRSKIRYIIFCLSFAFLTPAKAQKVSDELKKVRNAYTSNKQLSFDVEVYSYETKADKTPELISKGYMKKSNDKYYSNYEGMELMVNGDKALIVDNEKKTMTFYEYKLSKQKTPKGFEANIDSVLLQSDSVVIQPTKSGIKHFTCFSNTGDIQQTEIYVDEKTNLINHILYYYFPSNDDYEMQTDRVEIFYKNIKTQGIDEAFFSFDKYFKTVKAKLIPTVKYQGYKVNHYNSK